MRRQFFYFSLSYLLGAKTMQHVFQDPSWVIIDSFTVRLVIYNKSIMHCYAVLGSFPFGQFESHMDVNSCPGDAFTIASAHISGMNDLNLKNAMLLKAGHIFDNVNGVYNSVYVSPIGAVTNLGAKIVHKVWVCYSQFMCVIYL